jgi:pSer/pThr/pTyr-binding forkhead associated (FHA) protein
MALLMMISEDGSERAWPLEKQRLRVGREPDCDIPLDDPSVSRRHLVLNRVYNEYFLEDQNSTNGTVVNGRRVFKHMLKHDDVLEVGAFRFRYEKRDELDPEEQDSDLEETLFVGENGKPLVESEAKPEEKARAHIIAETEKTPPETSLRMLNGKHEGKRVLLTKPVLAIGPKGSRSAAVVRKGEIYFLMKLGDGEVPSVNGEPVPRGGTPLKDGDVLEVAGRLLRFVVKS